MMKTAFTVLNYSINRFFYPPKLNNYDLTVSWLKIYSKFCSAKNCRREYCSESKNPTEDKKRDSIGGSVAEHGKFELFRDENAPLILDVIEEQQRIQNLEIAEENDEFAGLNLERGKTGVFDIEDLIEVLRRERAKDVFVAKLPSHLQYVDYIVVVSARSLKHMLGLAEFVKKLYKIKRNKTDKVPRVEGENSKHWLALDLGNIALHIMSKSARPDYDLESLWAVGKEYDEKSCITENNLAALLKKHCISLDDFQPADTLR